MHKHHLTGMLHYIGKIMMLHMQRIYHIHFTFLNVKFLIYFLHCKSWRTVTM